MRINFIEPSSFKALYELKNLPGVRNAEGFRRVPARFVSGHKSYRTAIYGIEPGSRLHLLLDTNLHRVAIPPEGIVINDYLAGMLDIRTGDLLTVEILEGAKPVRPIQVAGTAKLFLGVLGYMDTGALNRLMREGNAISGAYLLIDSLQNEALFRTFTEMPRVSGMIRVCQDDKAAQFMQPVNLLRQFDMILFIKLMHERHKTFLRYFHIGEGAR